MNGADRGSSPALSIVIPAATDASALEDTLVSVLEHRPADCEVVVAPDFAYDDPWNIREEVSFVQAPPRAGIVACTNLGIASSRGRIVHVLAAGWRATPGWIDHGLAPFGTRDVAAVAPVGVAADAPDRATSVGVRVTRGGRRIGITSAGRATARQGTRLSAPLLEAAFWRADVLRAIGPGFSTACGELYADADVAPAIEALGMRVVVAGESRVIAGGQRRQPRAFRSGLHAERLFWRSLGVRSTPVALAAHGLEIIRDAIVRLPMGTLPMLAGRVVALMEFGRSVPRARHLQALARDVREDEPRSIVRIDASHPQPARPHGRPASPEPLRRSA